MTMKDRALPASGQLAPIARRNVDGSPTGTAFAVEPGRGWAIKDRRGKHATSRRSAEGNGSSRSRGTGDPLGTGAGRQDAGVRRLGAADRRGGGNGAQRQQ